MARSHLTQPVIPDAPGRRATVASRHSTTPSLIIAMRPGQWTKNLLVFAALIFAERLFDLGSVLRTVAAFAVFCALSGAVYLVNDVADRESDRQHPLKRRRPIAAGAVSVPTALMTATVASGAALTGAFALGLPFGLIAASYLALQLLYSGLLKHFLIIDVLTIAIGFVQRAAGGALVIDVEFSQWLLVCTILLALFIAMAKRRHELTLLTDDATNHRPILGEYTPYLLDQMIAVVTASTLIAYIFYTISPETVAKFGTTWLGLTIPFPLYGIFRYLYLVHRRDGGGSPAELLLTDRPLLACIILWVIAVVLIIYRPVAF